MTHWDEPSPFIFDGPLPPNLLIGREVEADRLRAWARAGRFTVLVAPRRYGKTSLLQKVSADAEQHDRMATILVDLYDVASTTDFVLRLERAWARYAPQRLRRAIGNVFAGAQVGLNIHGTGFTMRLADRPRTDPLPALHTLLDLPNQVHIRGERILIVFDEFQSLAGVDGAEALIRSHAQHQRETASYIFAGSQPSMLAAMFGDQARPFYGQAQAFSLPRLDLPTLAAAITDMFEGTGRDGAACIGDLVAASEGHPQRAMLLAHLLFQRTDPQRPAAAPDTRAVLEEALARVESEARAVLDGLTAVETKTMRAIAEYGTPLAARAARDLNLKKAAAANASANLSGRGLVEHSEDEGWRVVDPLLGRWLRTRYPTRTTPT